MRVKNAELAWVTVVLCLQAGWSGTLWAGDAPPPPKYHQFPEAPEIIYYENDLHR